MACSVLRAPPALQRTSVQFPASLRRPSCNAWRHTASGPSLQTTRTRVISRAGGAGVLDSPTTTTTPERGTENVYKRPPIYKVFLHNDSYNKREYVVKVLLKVVQEITVDDAVVAMQEAHETGVALVVACPQDNAEQYCEGLRLNGLTCTIEPSGC